MSDTHIKGKQGIIIGYNHIDSVDEYAPAIRIGYVLLQLRHVIVGGKLVPLWVGWGGLWNRGRILMPQFCSSIPQHLGPLVWAPRSLVTTDLSRQGRRAQQGGRCIGSWQPVAVLLTEAGLPHCLSHLDPLQLLHQCLNLWEAFIPERHSSPAHKKH